MTAEQAVTAVFGAGLTLFGAIILFLLQAAQKYLEDRRQHHREWHRELVNILADLDRSMIFLSGMLRERTIFTPEMHQSVTVDVYSDKGLYWRMQRIERGHPDRRVRDMMFTITYALINIVRHAHQGVQSRVEGKAPRLAGQQEKVEDVLNKFADALFMLGSIVHEDERGRPYLSRLKKIRRRKG